MSSGAHAPDQERIPARCRAQAPGLFLHVSSSHLLAWYPHLAGSQSSWLASLTASRLSPQPVLHVQFGHHPSCGLCCPASSPPWVILPLSCFLATSPSPFWSACPARRPGQGRPGTLAHHCRLVLPQPAHTLCRIRRAGSPYPAARRRAGAGTLALTTPHQLPWKPATTADTLQPLGTSVLPP